MARFAVVGISLFALVAAPRAEASSWWRTFTDFCGLTAAEEAGEEPANPVPAFLKEALGAEYTSGREAALKAAGDIYPGFEPTHGPQYTNPTPERVAAWKGLLALTQLKNAEGKSTYDEYLDVVGEAETMDGDDVDLYTRWLVAAGVYLKQLGESYELVFQHAHALGLGHLSFVRSLPPEAALLYIQGSDNYSGETVATYLEELEELYAEWGRLFQAMAERRGQNQD